MHHQYQNESPWFWRDNNGNEVDLFLDKGLSLEILEMKASTTVLTENFNNLTMFGETSDLTISEKGNIYAGTSNQNRLQGKVISCLDSSLV